MRNFKREESYGKEIAVFLGYFAAENGACDQEKMFSQGVTQYLIDLFRMHFPEM